MANAATSKQSGAGRSRQAASTSSGRERARERSSDSRELTGERDEHYNLIAVLYHGLQGADQCAMYADDADESGDEELAEFLRAAGRTQGELARRAKELLLTRVKGGGASRDMSDEEDDEMEDDDDE